MLLSWLLRKILSWEEKSVLVYSVKFLQLNVGASCKFAEAKNNLKIHSYYQTIRTIKGDKNQSPPNSGGVVVGLGRVVAAPTPIPHISPRDKLSHLSNNSVIT